jgi:hypothetical protein
MKILISILISIPFVAFQPHQHPNKQIDKGKQLAKSCLPCHLATKEFTGPPLKRIRKIRSMDWIYQYTQNPPLFISKNKKAKALQKKYGSVMTAFSFNKKEINLILDYYDSLPDDSK